MRNEYLSHLVDRLVSIYKEVDDTLDNCSSEQLNQPPSPRKWSIGQILQHVILWNEAYFPQLERVSQSDYRKSGWEKIPVLGWFRGWWLRRSVRPGRRLRSRTKNDFQPQDGNLPVGIISEFVLNNQKLIGYINTVDQLDDHKKIKVTAPTGKSFTMNLFNYLKMMVDHEERHLRQLRKVQRDLDLKNKPGTSD